MHAFEHARCRPRTRGSGQNHRRHIEHGRFADIAAHRHPATDAADPVVTPGPFSRADPGHFSRASKLTKGVPAYTFPFPIPGDSYPSTVNVPGWFIVAEYEESAARPVPQFSTGGPCDPAPTCNFSRRLEQVRFRALTDLPLLYFVHGCLDPVPLPGLDELVAGLDGGSETPMIESLGSMGAMALMPTLSTPTGSSTGAMNFYANEITDCFLSMLVPQVFDYLNGLALSVCCARPGLALGIVLQVTLGDLPDDVAAVVVANLGTHPVYTLVLDGFPYRRLIGNSANNLTLIQIVLSALVCSGGGGGAPA